MELRGAHVGDLQAYTVVNLNGDGSIIRCMNGEILEIYCYAM